MGEQKADTEPGIESQLGNDGLEIVAIGAETVQPYDAGIGFVHTGFDYQGFISHGFSRSLQRPAL